MSLGPRSIVGLGLGLATLVIVVSRWPEPRPVATAPDGEARALAAQLEAERSAWRAAEAELTERLTVLEAALASEQELRLAREAEWLEFTQLVSSLDLTDGPPLPEFLAPAEIPAGRPGTTGEPATSEAGDPAEAAALRAAAAALALDERGRAMRASLGALLTAEQVQSLDFRKLGRPHVFEGRGVVGPVVARLVDDRGRLVGHLFAERLWVEVSRAARCVTLVFEDGYEIRGGVRHAFEAASPSGRSAPALDEEAELGASAAPVEVTAPRGVQRIFLPSVDPAPWLEALPEIIDQRAEVAPPDDGVYDLVALRLTLNELLRKAGTEAGEGWRLHALGGVRNGVLRDVQLVEHAADGDVVRRLFADRLEVHKSDRAIELVLEEGSQERNGRLAPFLDGRYRVALPHARADDWVAAGIPGAARTR